VLVEVAGQPVTDAQAMLGLIALLEPGKKAQLKLKRNGQDIMTEVTIGKRPRPQRRRQ
jgi:S1-C subfamily serine protease